MLDDLIGWIAGRFTPAESMRRAWVFVLGLLG
jgi:hypothetical protein